MSEKQGISVKAAVLYGLAIIVVAFIGVLLGSWFVEWRQARNAPGINQWTELNTTSFDAGKAFPSEELLNMDSNQVSVASVVTGRKTVILFLSPGCVPCATAVNFWKKGLKDFPSDLAVIGIIEGDFAEAKAYQIAKEITFPVYCDPLRLYAQQYDIMQFPTLVGLDDTGRITLIWHGTDPRLKVKDYYNIMTSFVPPAKQEES